MSITSELLALKDENGLIVVEKVHDWARDNVDSALHSALDWNNETAGYKWRLWQIRYYMNIAVTSEQREPQFISLTPDRRNGSGGGYREIGDVLQARNLRDQMLKDALAELDRIQEKYKTLKDLADVWAAKDNVKRRRRPVDSREVRIGA